MGVKVEILKPGDGKTFPENGDEVTVKYVGKLPDGKPFDPFDGHSEFTYLFGSGQVIDGWNKGIKKMSLGESARLTITGNDTTDEHGDAVQGFQGIPGMKGGKFIYEIKLLRIKKTAE